MNLWTKALVLGAGLAAIGVAAIAQEEGPQAKRTILQRQDVAGTTKESIIGLAELPAGAAIGMHTHPGEEIGYVLKGPLVLKFKGRAGQRLQAGQSYIIPAGTVHDAHGADGGEAKVVSVWIVEKGQPLATPAQ